MNILTIIINELAEHANDQATIAANPNMPERMRDDASTHYGTLLLILSALDKARAKLLKQELDRLEGLLREAAPAGANPKIHPSMQPPSGDAPTSKPHLEVVKEDTDAHDN